MALPYTFFRSLQDSRALPFNMELEVSLNVADGIPLKWSANGKLTPISVATDRPLFILQSAAQTSSTGSLVNLGSTPQVLNQIGNGYNAQAGPGGNQQVQQLGGYADVIPAQNGLGIWRTTFTPFLKNIVSATTGSATSISLLNSTGATIAANQLQGGTLYCSSLNQQVQITANAAATNGNPCVITTVAPLGQPGATTNADGLTFSATPLGKGMANLQFSHVTSVSADGYVPSQTGVGTADWSGGIITVHEVDIQNGFVFVIFQ